MATNRARGPIRIAYPIGSLQIGGAELRALSLAERLPRSRFEVEFLSLTGSGALDQRAAAAGLRVRHVGSASLHASSLPRRAIGRAGKLRRYRSMVLEARYDIVDAWLYPTDVFVALGRQLTRTPIVMSGRADLLPRDAFGPLSRVIDRVVNRLVDAVVANSEAVADSVRGRDGVDPESLHVIRNGVELPAPITTAERRRLRAQLGAADDDLLVGSVGMLREVKNHRMLIEAFADIARERPELRLAIIGEGPTRPHLERQIESLGLGSRIVLTGAVLDVRPMFDAFDVVASSSMSEGMPNALLEAAAAGRPVVSTAAGGAVEVVVDGDTGLVVPVGDRDAMSNALATVASSAELRDRMGAEARQHVRSTFGMQRFVQEWSDLYERLAIAKGLVS